MDSKDTFSKAGVLCWGGLETGFTTNGSNLRAEQLGIDWGGAEIREQPGMKNDSLPYAD